MQKLIVKGPYEIHKQNCEKQAFFIKLMAQ